MTEKDERLFISKLSYHTLNFWFLGLENRIELLELGMELLELGMELLELRELLELGIELL